MKNRILRSPDGTPHDDLLRPTGIAHLHEGDLVLWRGCLVRVLDVTDFAHGEVYVTVTFTSGRGRRPLSLKGSDLVGAEVWCAVGRFSPADA
jgi:hypothetical protein